VTGTPTLAARLRCIVPLALVALLVCEPTDSGAAAVGSPLTQASCVPQCKNATLTAPNFSHANLVNASFAGATLIAPSFIHADLTGADFTGATFLSATGNSVQAPDFTFATLTHAKFIGAKFSAPTYFTYATLTCADFSGTDMAHGKAVFGDEGLSYDSNASCMMRFEGATMNCEFIDQWRFFDLKNANIAACLDSLAGRNFANAHMAGVSFAGGILDAASFAGADLRRAVLEDASLQCADTIEGMRCVDLSGAQLQGASLDRANLTGASLYQAVLTNDNPDIVNAATLRQAHLKNVNLSSAQLSGTDFSFANFYGSASPNHLGCATSGSGGAGFTDGCASAAGAQMTGTRFPNAYLYGTDFSNASIIGVDFSQAVLVGANFAGADIDADPTNGAATTFFRAYLQGTNLDQAATLSRANLSDAFVDFRPGGNLISIDLDGSNHNQFACSTPSGCRPETGQNVCVSVRYPVTTVPSDNATITCPGDKSAGQATCGDADGDNARWNSRLAIGKPPNAGPPPGWYANDATYTHAAPPGEVCSGRGPQARVFNW
jgi:uncharacterized protein YjbI with pentapeptide repeats